MGGFDVSGFDVVICFGIRLNGFKYVLIRGILVLLLVLLVFVFGEDGKEFWVNDERFVFRGEELEIGIIGIIEICGCFVVDEKVCFEDVRWIWLFWNFGVFVVMDIVGKLVVDE